MNKNYIRGVNIEYKIKKLLEEQGYYVSRSSGSHGAVDIIAINKDGVRLIQSKRSKLALNPNFAYGIYQQDMDKLKALDVPSNTSKELWVWLDKKGFMKYKLVGNDIVFI